MSIDPIKDFKISFGDDNAPEEDLIDRFGEALAPLIGRVGFEGVETIGVLVTRMQAQDAEAVRQLMEKSPSIIKGLLAFGEKEALGVFDLAHRLCPLGGMPVVRFLEISPQILIKGDWETLTRSVDLISGMIETNTSLARSLLEKSPQLIESGGLALLEEAAFYGAALAQASPTYASRFLESSSSLWKQLVSSGGPSLALSMYRLGGRMAYQDWECAWEWIRSAPALAEKYQARGVKGLLIDLCQQENRAQSFIPLLTLTFLETAVEIISCLDRSGLERVRSCAGKMAESDVGKAVTLLRETPILIRALWPHLLPAQVNELYGEAIELGRFSPALAFSFLSSASVLVPRIDLGGLKHFSRTVQDIAGSSLGLAEALLSSAPALLGKTDSETVHKMIEGVKPLAAVSWETASRLVMKSPDLFDILGSDGFREFTGFLETLSKESVSAANQLLDNGPEIWEQLLPLGGLALISEIFNLGREVSRKNARLCISLLIRSPELIKRSGVEGMKRVGELAEELGQSSWTAAVSLVENAALLLGYLTIEELETLSDLVQRISRDNSYAAVSLIEKGPDFISRLRDLGAGDKAGDIYFLISEAALHKGRMVSGFLERGPQLFADLGQEGFKKLITLLVQLAKINGQIAVRFLELSHSFFERQGLEGLDTVARLMTSLAGPDWMAALSLLEKLPALIERLGYSREGAVLPAVFDLAGKVARISPAAAVKLLEKSPEFLGWVGLEGFGRIAAFIEKIAEEDEERALSFLSSDSPSWVDFMENIPKGLELNAIKSILSHYLKALLGRRIEIAEGEEACGDGQKIYLPRRIREFQDQEDNFLLYKVAATHEEAHLEYGSYELDLSRMEDCLRELEARYGYPAGEEGSDLERFLGCFPEPDLAADLFNLLEDRRIEKRLGREYPILGEVISRMNRHRVSKRPPALKMIHPKQRVMEMIGQTLKAGKSFPEADPPSRELLEIIKKEEKRLDPPEVDVHESARLAADLYILIDRLFSEPYRPVQPHSKPLDQEKVARNIGSFGKTSQHIQDRLEGKPGPISQRRQEQPEGESGNAGETQPSPNRPTQEPVQQRKQPGRRSERTFQGPAGGGKQEAVEAETEAEETGEVGEALKFDSREKIERLVRALYREKGVTPRELERRLESMNRNELFLFLNHLEASFSRKTELSSEKGTFLYPEWGEDIQDYRGNWVRVREQTLGGKSLTFYQRTLDKHAGLLKKIRREFELLKPEGFIRRKRQYDGDDIDLEAVVDFWSDRKAGLSPVEKYYTLTRKKKRDIAVAFLIDMSRSTKGRVIEKEKEALIIMSEALNEVGDVFAVFGFSGDNRDNVDFFRIKGFDNAYDARVKKRISAISDRFENRDGAAIRHVIGKLRGRAEGTRLLILLSDGKPVDKEYSGLYAIEDTRLALKEAQHLGVKTFCITVDQEAAEYLPRMYSHSRWTVLDRVEKLPEKITRIYRNLTG